MAAEDKCGDWLARLDIPIEETTTVEKLKDYLHREMPGYTEAQVDALVAAQDIKVDYGEHGIRQVPVQYPWGWESRYGVQGMPGLWGWERIQEIREEEEW